MKDKVIENLESNSSDLVIKSKLESKPTKEKKKKNKHQDQQIELDANGCQMSVVTFDDGNSIKKKKRKAAVCTKGSDESDADAVTLPSKKVKLQKENGTESIKKKKSKTQLVEDSPGIVAVSNGNDHYSNGHSTIEETVKVSNKIPKNIVDDPKPKATSGAFENYRISAAVCERLKGKGILSLFPVQTMSYDVIYDNFDVIVQSRTGSGKTLSFAIPLVERLLEKDVTLKPRRSPRVLVMAPTRELAKQVSETFEMLCSPLSVLCVYGGTPIMPQVSALRAGADILVGTPGRIQDLIRRGNLDLSLLTNVVLDEVDRMLDMGFADDVDEILKERFKEGDVENNPQTLLFSATLPHWVHQTAQKYLRKDKKHIDLVGDDLDKTSKTVQHLAICCGYFERASTIGAVLQVYSGSQGRAMIFCETKREADELALNQDIRQETHVIHGDIPQAKRDLVLSGFREGRYKCLIATDVAARGLDIPEVDLVIQCCPPKDVESYIHRSGRTGRAGRDGTCVLFYKPREESELSYVERKAGITFKRIGPPTAGDIIKACTEDAIKSLDLVPQSTLKYFSELAEKLVSEKDVIRTVSAALAIISGNAEMKPRSLLSSRENFTTFLFRTTVTMDRHGYVWRALEKCVSAELREKISWMTFCADKQGCVFDVPTDLSDALVQQWKDGRGDTLVVASELPEIVKPEKAAFSESNGWHGNGFGGGRGRGSPGGRGRWGGGRENTSFNRDFNRNGMPKRNAGGAAGFGQNKRTTF